MENALMIAAVAGPVFLLIGVSVLLHAKTWRKVFDKWQKDHFSLFSLMLLITILGLVVISMYNVWELNVYILVTLIGWIMLLKGAVYFLLPGSVLKGSLGLGKSLGLLYFGGLVWGVVGAVLTYYAYFV